MKTFYFNYILLFLFFFVQFFRWGTASPASPDRTSLVPVFIYLRHYYKFSPKKKKNSVASSKTTFWISRQTGIFCGCHLFTRGWKKNSLIWLNHGRHGYLPSPQLKITNIPKVKTGQKQQNVSNPRLKDPPLWHPEMGVIKYVPSLFFPEAVRLVYERACMCPSLRSKLFPKSSPNPNECTHDRS